MQEQRSFISTLPLFKKRQRKTYKGKWFQDKTTPGLNIYPWGWNQIKNFITQIILNVGNTSFSSIQRNK